MASYFISGASRGIGLGMCEALAKRPASEVSVIYAGARTETDGLKSLAERSGGRVEIVRLDATVEDDVKSAAAQVEKSLGGKGLDVLINNAGVMPMTPEGIAKMTDLEPSFKTNVLSVQLVTSHFFPLLQKGSLKKIVNVSSTVGSFSMSRAFSFMPAPAYKITKAALNMLTYQYALTYAEEGFTIIAVSPGWVKTELGGGDRAQIDVETSVNALFDIIDTVTTKDNGKFLDVRVPGWEEAPGPNHYLGGEAAW